MTVVAAMYHEVHARDFAARAQSPAIMELFRIYGSCGAGGLPAAAEMPVARFPEHAPFLMLLEPDGDTHLYAHYGSGVAEAAGFDMTGRRLTDFDGALGAFFAGVYARSRDERRPLFTIHRALKARSVHTWERLVMPLAFPCGGVGFLVYNRPRQFKQDFLAAMLEVLPDAVMAVQAIRDDDGRVEDLALMQANGAARALFSLGADDVEQGPVRAKLEPCGAGAVWDACLRAIMERARTSCDVVCLCCSQARHIKLDVTPLNDGAVLRFSDVTVLTTLNHDLEARSARLDSELASERSQSRRLRREAVIDPLTGLLNRRGFEAYGAALWRADGPLTAVVADIDHFKRVNDLYGHVNGDKVLRHAAVHLARVANAHGGVAARWGGEEFLMLLPLDAGASWRAVDMLRVEFGLRPVATTLGPVCATASFGIADARLFEALEDAVAAADAELYRAKEEGRNRTCADLALDTRGAA